MPEGNDCGQEREKPNKTGKGCRGAKNSSSEAEGERGLGRNNPNLTSGKESEPLGQPTVREVFIYIAHCFPGVAQSTSCWTHFIDEDRGGQELVQH